MTRLADGTLDPQGPVAEAMTKLWWIMLWLGVGVFAVFAVVLVIGLSRRRPRGEDERPPAPRSVSGRWFAAGGVVLPAIIVLAVLVATIVAMRAIPSAAPRDALVVEIVGHQWWWEVRYPDENVTTANELHIPVGRPVALRLTARDVIHSFWVPRLGGKIDMLPDGTNTLVLQADEPGEHFSQCAEFCGLGHANMALTVVAEPEDRFTEWLMARQRAAEEPTGESARRGLEVFLADCAGCHTIRRTTPETSKGPDLTHLASRPTLGAGTVANTRANLAHWVSDPRAMKPGVKMPATDLREEELDALLDYLERLE